MATARRRRLKLKATLRQKLVLPEFLAHAFGGHNPRELLDALAEVAEEDGSLLPEKRLQAMQRNFERPLPALETYDRNLQRHERRLRLTSEFGRGLKPHQYLPLLFTEYYLNRYFTEPSELLEELNQYLAAKHRELPPYVPSDLETIAFQSATGSGKTLLMHVHIEQYRHYAERAGRRVRSVILLTPNERMSEQHLRELRASRLPARLFTPHSRNDLFRPVEVFDVNKLAEKKGVKRVAVSEFGGDNLVLVDEGHLGASGTAWRQRRAELGRGGFTFEYSATFDQIVGKDVGLMDSYAKSLLFDYPYRDFHENGYGKDYSIVNLREGVEAPKRDPYLLGCLLTFYRQLRSWRDHGREWRPFHLARPLWAFLGRTVLGSQKSNDAETVRSDVAHILDFFGRFLAERRRMEEMISVLLAGASGLRDESGGDWFSERLGSLGEWSPADLYKDVCETLFYGTGHLHVEYLVNGGGELHLRAGDRPVFGVVNVGDAAGLYQRLAAAESPHLKVERNLIGAPLFAEVDREESPVNVVIGARRFIAGWNSWRVSTMGLMHVGKKEGPEIVQMFGRGVRLKGWNLSLKRHGPSGAPLPNHPEELAELETLHIFGLRANYMDTFRQLMRDQGFDLDTATVRLPVTWNFGRVRDLQMLRLRSARPFERSDERVPAPGPGQGGIPVVRRSLYSTLESEASRAAIASEWEDPPQLGNLAEFAELFDAGRVYERVLAKKQQKGWWNLEVDRDVVRHLLECGVWYDLSIPPEQLRPRSVADLRRLEELAGDLVLEYLERSWRRSRSRWEETQLTPEPLDEKDANHIREYQVTGHGPDAKIIRDLEGLCHTARGTRLAELQLSQILTSAHAYEPLLWIETNLGHRGEVVRTVEVRPVPLNRAEKDVVDGLRRLAEESHPVLGGHDLYLIRNLSRGRGVSFFDDFGYYPDFIVWLRRQDEQHILFLDPKGLGRFGRREREKVKLHHRIKGIEARLRERRAGQKPDLHLHAYVLSTTPPDEIDEGRRSAERWKQDGVYFLKQQDSIRELIKHALENRTG